MSKLNLRKKEIEKVTNMCNDYKEKYNHTLTDRENKIAYYLMAFPEKTRNEAQAVVDGIYDGVREYTKNLEELIAEEKISVKERFCEALSDRPVEEIYSEAMNLLLALEAIDSAVVDGNNDRTTEENAEIFNEFIKRKVECNPGSVDRNDLEELLEKLDDAVNTTAFGYYGIEEAKKLVEEDGNSIEEFVVNYWQMEDYKAMLAFITYIVITKEGNEDITPNEVAVFVSSGVDRDAVIKQASMGSIAWETAKKILGYIGSAAMVALIFIAIWKITEISMMVGVAVMVAVLGYSFLPMLLGAVLGCLFVMWIADGIAGNYDDIRQKGYEIITVAKEKVVAGYNTVVGFVKDKVVPFVSEKCAIIRDFVKDKILGGFVRTFNQTVSNDRIRTQLS